MGYAFNPGRGLRLYDEWSAKADRLSHAFEGLANGVTPSHVLSALKRAAPYLGIPLRVVTLVDQLFAWTKPQDWLSGCSPIVWPSNEVLAQKLGVTVRQVQKLLKQAQSLGLITFKDSPNGHRGGRRRDDGTIAWAYGVVLAPIGARLEEFRARAEQGAAEDAAVVALRKRLAAARRAIREMAQAAFNRSIVERDASEALDLALMATEQMRGVRDLLLLEGCVEQLEERKRRLSDALRVALASEEDPNSSDNCSCSHVAEFADSTTTTQHLSAEADTSRGSSKKGSGRYEAGSWARRPTTVEEELDKQGIGADMVFALASELYTGDRSRPVDWPQLINTAERLAHQTGISRHAFHEACRVMGERGAAASVIATVQKFRSGDVQKPGAYLRGMTAKAERQELHLSRTLFGLRDSVRGSAMRAMADGSDPTPIGFIAQRLTQRFTSRHIGAR